MTKNELTLAALAPLLMSLCLSMQATAATVDDAHWLGAAGNYADPTQWDTNPDVPNNNGTTYNVFIGPAAGPVTLDLSPTIDSLSLDTSDLTVAPASTFDLNILGGLTWTGGTHGGAGTTTVGGTADLRNALLDARTLQLNGSSFLRTDTTLSNGARIVNDGTLQFALSSADLFGDGTFVNHGTVNQVGLSNINRVDVVYQQGPAGVLDLKRILVLRNNSTIDGQITLGSFAKLQFDALALGTTHTITAAITGNGQVAADPLNIFDPAVTFTGPITLTAGGSFVVDNAVVSVDVTPSTTFGDGIMVDTFGDLTLKLKSTAPGSVIGQSAPPHPPAALAADSDTFNLPLLQFNQGQVTINPLGLINPDNTLVIDLVKSDGVSSLVFDPPPTNGEFGAITLRDTEVLSGQWRAFTGIPTSVHLTAENMDLAVFASVFFDTTAPVELPVGSQATLGGNSELGSAPGGQVDVHGAVLFFPPAQDGLPTKITGPIKWFPDSSLTAEPGANVEISKVEQFDGVTVDLQDGSQLKIVFTDENGPSGLPAASDLLIKQANATVQFEDARNGVAPDGTRMVWVGDEQYALPSLDYDPAGGSWQARFQGSTGHSPGQLTITGNVQILPGSNQTYELAGLAAGAEYDQLIFNGQLTLGGDLTLMLLDGFELQVQPGDLFTIITADRAIDGAFDNVAPGQRLLTGDGLGSFLVNYGPGSPFGASDVVLSDYQAAPEPTSLALVGAGGLVLLRRRRRRRRAISANPRRC